MRTRRETAKTAIAIWKATRRVISKISLARNNLGGLHSAHLLNPRAVGLHLSDRTQLLTRVAGDADVVGALQDQLNVADFEDLGAALLGVPAGLGNSIINE